MTVERLDSYKFNTMKIVLGGELPCYPEELLNHSAHNELNAVLAEQMHVQYLEEGALLDVWTNAIVDLEKERRGVR